MTTPSTSKVYRVFNRIAEESSHIVFDEINIFQSREVDLNDDVGSLKRKMKETCLDETPRK